MCLTHECLQWLESVSNALQLRKWVQRWSEEEWSSQSVASKTWACSHYVDLKHIDVNNSSTSNAYSNLNYTGTLQLWKSVGMRTFVWNMNRKCFCFAIEWCCNSKGGHLYQSKVNVNKDCCVLSQNVFDVSLWQCRLVFVSCFLTLFLVSWCPSCSVMVQKLVDAPYTAICLVGKWSYFGLRWRSASGMFGSELSTLQCRTISCTYQSRKSKELKRFDFLNLPFFLSTARADELILYSCA